MLDFSSCPTNGGKSFSGVMADKKFWSHLAMPIVNRIAEFEPELIEWRHHLHSFPELGFEEYKTSDFVAEKLSQMPTKGLGLTKKLLNFLQLLFMLV